MISDVQSSKFQRRFLVSRETIDRLNRYEALIRKWNPAINLISNATLESLWDRHFLDSAELFAMAEKISGKWVDLGSGGGFPGAVVAIMAKELAPNMKITCIESDHRKCEFLRTVSRETNVEFGVNTSRIEKAPPQTANVISARALAPLDRLLALAHPHLAAGGECWFHKGATWQAEIDAAQKNWSFSLEKFPNTNNPDSVVLRIGDIKSG